MKRGLKYWKRVDSNTWCKRDNKDVTIQIGSEVRYIVNLISPQSILTYNDSFRTKLEAIKFINEIIKLNLKYDEINFEFVTDVAMYEDNTIARGVIL